MTSVHAEVTINNFSGVWRSYFHVPHVNVLTPQGPVFLCHDELPPQCDAEIKPMEETYTFNGTTVAIEVRDRVGITTIEEAAAVHPECAKAGFYPVERVYSVPQSQITSYDPEAERLYYIDPRRPEDLNCVPARYRIGAKGPYIEIDHVIFYQGTVPEIFTRGLSFRCDEVPKSCCIEVDNNGELETFLEFAFTLTCIDGDCLDAVGAASPSPSKAPNESVDDL